MNVDERRHKWFLHGLKFVHYIFLKDISDDKFREFSFSVQKHINYIPQTNSKPCLHTMIVCSGEQQKIHCNGILICQFFGQI